MHIVYKALETNRKIKANAAENARSKGAHMIVCINEQFVDAREAKISVFDQVFVSGKQAAQTSGLESIA